MTFIQLIASGLLIGGVYALLAGGITLIFGVLKVVNFAHGDFMMVGMFLTFFLNQGLGLSPYVALPIVAIVMFAFGALIHYGLIQWTINSGHTRQIVLTLGIGIVLQSLALVLFGGNFRSATMSDSFTGAISLGPINLGMTRVIAFVIAIVVTVALLVFLDKTLIGKAIRATAMDGYAAQLMGIPVKRIYLITMGVGAALAGIAAAVLLPIYPVFPTIGMTMMTIAFVVVVLGGLGSVVGALIGGLIVGVVESVSGYFVGAALSQVIVLALFGVILVVLPRGIMKGEAA
ncbi:branched-chain amino acid ABC transporter permease [Paeniglutamicibacter sulfureus]|uniref:branched-chain amino acid ABC transporter permease n=1 Tax=Paeniglutamicibacter sulfureus TaxID=43666 RepID=UPI0026658C32|nr:branched-chain amino acid ABC transporter permease [Paeniglutamicibacter sulfureus]MDO2934661.1 branched-chain amino acid ABC transporter permease [Paeniglutamicibacter sulfureus]